MSDSFDKVAADRLAYAVAHLVLGGRIGSRSKAADCLMDYLQIGTPDGFSTVPEWIADYEAKHSPAREA